MMDAKFILGEESLQEDGMEQRSEMTSEIIAYKPKFAEKWALLIFLMVLAMLIAATWFVKYPDVIQANASLTAINAPKDIVTRQEGKIVRLFVSNDDKVGQGQTIAWMESTASHDKMIRLSALLDTGVEFLLNGKSERVSFLFRSGMRGLGEIQPAYQVFATACQQFNDYLVNGYYFKQKRVLYGDMVYLQKMHLSLEGERGIALQDLQLMAESYDSNNSLYREKVISMQDLRDQKSKLLAKQMSMPQIEYSLLSNENLQTAKQKEIDELEHTISQQKEIFQEALQTLKSLVDDWKRKYLITAPVEGKVVFVIPLQQNQYLQSGKTIGFVDPPDSRYYAQVMLPQINFGKIRLGEMVQLRFEAYPYQEFGFVEGKLCYISKVPSDSGFLANIELPKGLATSYKREIQYRSGLKSEALIITQNARLLQRFYYSILKNGIGKN